MKEIKLTQNKVAIIDDTDFEIVSRFRWFFNRGYASSGMYPNTIHMHHLVLRREKGFDVDHINGNKLDNRRSNLRLATRSENQMNCHNPRFNKTSYKGVSQKGNRFQSKVRYKGQTVYLGSFLTKEEAAYAYNEMAKKLYGDFAVLNNIDGAYGKSWGEKTEGKI